MEKTVICYCAGGLGNRLLPMASCHALAKQTGRRLLILWRDDDVRCQVSFSDLFSNPVSSIGDEEMAGLANCQIHADLHDVYKNFYLTRKDTLIKLIEKNGIHDRNHIDTDSQADHIIIYHNSFLPGADQDKALDFLRRLRPNAEIQQHIDCVKQAMGIDASVFGVHARGTDFHVSADQYAEKIRRVLNHNPRQRVLVCSDDQAYEKRLQSLFPDNVITRPKLAHVCKVDASSPSWVNNLDTSRESVREAVVDIFLLAATDFKIYHEGSSFARLVLILHADNKCKTPPREIPSTLLPAFTMKGRIPIETWYINEVNREGNLKYSFDFIEKLIDLARERKSCNYGDTDQWLYKMLDQYPIEGKTVLVMGSQVPFYEAVCIANGASPTTVEFQKIQSEHPRLNTITVAELMRSQVRFDAAISISTFEHTGLGRYGDPLDPDGDLKAMMLMRT
ncbi:MAG: nodulation protein NodZ, partial [Desulfosarcinaceae bacterium]